MADTSAPSDFRMVFDGFHVVPIPEPYPEHIRLTAISDQSQAIGEFLEWLGSQGVWLCEIPEPFNETFFPIHRSTQSLLADHFEIDQNRLEQEKRQMLDELRAMNN